MIKGILGQKLGMTQVFSEKGKIIPVTVIKVGPCVVVNKRTKDENGYEALQIGFGDIKDKNLNKPQKGYFTKKNVAPKRILKEFRTQGIDEYTIGQELRADIFKEQEFVDVSGISKGKGFQGVIKRWGFSGGKASHGSMHHRAPGSIGQSSDPSRVFKGVKMPGHQGHVQKVVYKLQVVKVDAENNLLMIRGSVPGPRNSFVVVKRTVKTIKEKKVQEGPSKKTKGKAK
ncbi:MAG: 50S ribosomal protein L3 [bacterium]